MHACRRKSGIARRIVNVMLNAIWLILPVVICLSQRLSHAGASPCRNKVKPRMAHYISCGSLDLRFRWITQLIVELIHVKRTSRFGESCFY